MIRTSRKLEVVAAACYAGSFLIWELGHEYKFFEPEFERGRELDALIHEIQQASILIENWEAAALGLLLVAVGLTVAAIRIRKSSKVF
jgi:hypothetical protein